jgi:uncharacterized protein
MNALAFAGFAALGVLVGAFGTLIGAGGGFLLLPLLMVLGPNDSPATLTAISLSVVFANALAGTISYARLRRIDYRAGILFALGGLPGAIVGALVTDRLDRRTFDPIFGGAMVVAAGLVLLRARRVPEPSPGAHPRRLVEADGTVLEYTPRVGLGVALSAVIGFVSSLLGIGGGVIHVPVMAMLLGFPIHVATATSHFVLVALSFVAVCVHAAQGNLLPVLHRVAPLALGVLVGAPVGAKLSSRVHGPWILRGLAVALAMVGVRLLLAR